MLSCWALRQQRSIKSSSTGMPSQMSTWASFSCLSFLTVSLMPPSVPQTPPHTNYTLQDEHVLISISGCPSPRYFLRNFEHHPPLSNPTFRFFSAQRPFSSNLFLPCCHLMSLFQAQLHACSLHDTLFFQLFTLLPPYPSLY